MGPNQAPRQAGPDTGAAEGVVHLFGDTTRGLGINISRDTLDKEKLEVYDEM